MEICVSNVNIMWIIGKQLCNSFLFEQHSESKYSFFLFFRIFLFGVLVSFEQYLLASVISSSIAALIVFSDVIIRFCFKVLIDLLKLLELI